MITNRKKFKRNSVCRADGNSKIYEVSRKSHIEYLKETEKERLEIIKKICSKRTWAVPIMGTIEIIIENTEKYQHYKDAGFLKDIYLVLLCILLKIQPIMLSEHFLIIFKQ